MPQDEESDSHAVREVVACVEQLSHLRRAAGTFHEKLDWPLNKVLWLVAELMFNLEIITESLHVLQQRHTPPVASLSALQQHHHPPL